MTPDGPARPYEILSVEDNPGTSGWFTRPSRRRRALARCGRSGMVQMPCGICTGKIPGRQPRNPI
jgi:hypothetical protein